MHELNDNPKPIQIEPLDKAQYAASSTPAEGACSDEAITLTETNLPDNAATVHQEIQRCIYNDKTQP